MKQLTAEDFLREKLSSEIQSFGDGTSEFHTRDIEHLLKCLDAKDEIIRWTERQCTELMCKINFEAEQKLIELISDCMTTSNLSAGERLSWIRNKYKDLYKTIKQ